LYLALSTLMWADRPLPEALDAAAATGIRAVDLAATADHAHIALAGGRAAIEALRPQLEGWRVAAVTADHPDLSRAEDEGGEEAVRHTVAAIQAAKQLGAEVVTVSLGGTQIDAWETAWNRALAALRQVLGETARTGMKVAVEINQDDVLDSLKKARRLLESVPNPRLGLALDTAWLAHLRIQLRDALEAGGERVHAVHLRDAAPADPYRTIGEGNVSFPAAFRALREYGYAGPLTVELLRREDVDADLKEAIPRLQAAIER
jgi:sugar phosphate isomerase/epimerase